MFGIMFRRRLTSGRAYLPEIDGLRAVAIIGVVVFHLAVYVAARRMAGASFTVLDGAARALAGIGCYGVEFFFTISGFLLVLPFARWRLGLGEAPSLRAYFLRRLTRLEPPYLLTMVASFLAGVALFGGEWGRAQGGALGASLLYQYGLLHGGPNPISSVAWSLEVEMVAYLVIPVAAAVFLLRTPWHRRTILVLLMLLPPLLRTGIPPEVTARYGASLPWYLEFFATGFLVADLHLTEWQEQAARPLAWDVAVLTACGALVLTLWRSEPGWTTPFLAMVVMAGALRGRWMRRLLAWPVLTLIGSMSYTIYLVHSPVISLVGRVGPLAAWGTTYLTRAAGFAVVAIPAVGVVTIGFYLLVERPCMDPAWPRRLPAWWRDQGTDVPVRP